VSALGLFFDRFVAPDGVLDPAGEMAGFDSFAASAGASAELPLAERSQKDRRFRLRTRRAEWLVLHREVPA
jgi:hypothetical protein